MTDDSLPKLPWTLYVMLFAPAVFAVPFALELTSVWAVGPVVFLGVLLYINYDVSKHRVPGARTQLIAFGWLAPPLVAALWLATNFAYMTSMPEFRARFPLHFAFPLNQSFHVAGIYFAGAALWFWPWTIYATVSARVKRTFGVPPAVRPTRAAEPSFQAASTPPRAGVQDSLEQAKALFERGLITSEEYAAKRKDLLARL